MTCGSKVVPSNVQPDSKASIQIWFWPLNSAFLMPTLTYKAAIQAGTQSPQASSLAPRFTKAFTRRGIGKEVQSSVMMFWCKKYVWELSVSCFHVSICPYNSLTIFIFLSHWILFGLSLYRPSVRTVSPHLCECVVTCSWQFCMNANGMTWISSNHLWITRRDSLLNGKHSSISGFL